MTDTAIHTPVFTARVQPPQAHSDAAADPVTGQATGQVHRLLLAQESGAAGIKERLQTLPQALVEMTQLDSPRSPTQKFRLTAKGKGAMT